jgi:hypothetical protein
MNLPSTIGLIQHIIHLAVMGCSLRHPWLLTGWAWQWLSVIKRLAVIAIITILAAMLLPVLTTANTRVNRIACLPDFKPFGLALTIYTDRSDDRIPI